MDKAKIQKIREGQLLGNGSNTTIFPVTLGKAVFPETIKGITKNLDKVLLNKCGYITVTIENDGNPKHPKYAYYLHGFADQYSATLWHTFRNVGDTTFISEEEILELEIFRARLHNVTDESESMYSDTLEPIIYYEKEDGTLERIYPYDTIYIDTIPVKIIIGWYEGYCTSRIISGIASLNSDYPMWYISGESNPMPSGYTKAVLTRSPNIQGNYTLNILESAAGGEVNVASLNEVLKINRDEDGLPLWIYPYTENGELGDNDTIKSRMYVTDRTTTGEGRCFPDFHFDIVFTKTFSLLSPVKNTSITLDKANSYSEDVFVKTKNATNNVTVAVSNQFELLVDSAPADSTNPNVATLTAEQANEGVTITVRKRADVNPPSETDQTLFTITYGSYTKNFNVYFKPAGSGPRPSGTNDTIFINPPYNDPNNKDNGVTNLASEFHVEIEMSPGTECNVRVTRTKSNVVSSVPALLRVGSDAAEYNVVTLTNDTEEIQTYDVTVLADNTASFVSASIRLSNVSPENVRVYCEYDPEPLELINDEYIRFILASNETPEWFSELPTNARDYINSGYGSVGFNPVFDGGIVPISDANPIIFDDTIDLDALSNLSNITMRYADDAYAGKTFTSKEIPNNILSIGDRCFANCVNLDSVTFRPVSICESIGDSAFYGCSSLEDITLPESITNLGILAFCNSGLKSIKLPGSIESLGRDALKSTSLQLVYLYQSDYGNDSLTIKERCFSGNIQGDTLTDFNVNTIICTLNEPPVIEYTEFRKFIKNNTIIYVDSTHLYKTSWPEKILSTVKGVSEKKMDEYKVEIGTYLNNYLKSINSYISDANNNVDDVEEMYESLKTQLT